MNNRQNCPHCGVLLPGSAARCTHCGASWNRFRSWTRTIGAILFLSLAGAILWKLAFSRLYRKPAEKAVPGIVATLQPGQREGALAIPNTLWVEYQDLGSMAEIVLTARDMPILYADVNRNGKIDSDGGDAGFAALPGDSVCVHRLKQSDIFECDSASSAVVHVEGGPGGWKVHWKIPKKELSAEGNNAYIAFQVFDEKTQRGAYYPGPPFSKVYELKFVSPEQVPVNAMLSPTPTPGPEISHVAGESTAPYGPMREPTHGQHWPRTSVPANEAVPVSIQFFKAEPPQVEAGTAVVLRWKVASATQVKIEPAPDNGRLPMEGEKTIFPEHSGDYTLIAQGADNAVSRRISISVIPASRPLIQDFNADSGMINKGGSTTLHWTVAGAQDIKLDPGWNSLPAQGEVKVSPEQTTEYTLTAEGKGQAVSRQIRINVTPARPSIVFEADPLVVTPGRSVTLRWNVSEATQVSIDPDLGLQNSQGAARITPKRTVRYTLSAAGPGGSSTKDLLISVNQPGPSAGQLVWHGYVNGVQLVTIDQNHADSGTLEGALPGAPCILQPANEKQVSIASAPSPRNNFERLVFRVTGHGPTTVVIKWSLQ